MKQAYFCCDPRSINDATSYYMDIIQNEVEKRGYKWTIINDIRDIIDPDLLITITERYFLNVNAKYPNIPHIYWSQGVGPEEIMWSGKGIKKYFRVLARTMAEKKAILKSTLVFFVSNYMIKHYGRKYGYKGNNYVVMPCYNLKLSAEFDVERYKKPTFVYAGGASVWQCTDEMCEVYKYIEQQMPEATLTILSGDRSAFEDLMKKYDIKNYEIKYVKKDFLDDELKKYKYGFLLREDNIVNKVATPTKMNSYLANYLIPIYTEAVDDFKQHIKLGEFTLCFSCPLNKKQIADKIIHFERDEHDFFQLKINIERIFEEHYNDATYANSIRQKLEDLHIH